MSLSDEIRRQREAGNDDSLIESMARAICGNHITGYCRDVGGDLGCRVGRGESFNGKNCIATRDALICSFEWTMASAALAAQRAFKRHP